MSILVLLHTSDSNNSFGEDVLLHSASEVTVSGIQTYILFRSLQNKSRWHLITPENFGKYNVFTVQLFEKCCNKLVKHKILSASCLLYLHRRGIINKKQVVGGDIMKKRLITVSVIIFIIIVGTVAVMMQKREINEVGTGLSADDEEYGMISHQEFYYDEEELEDIAEEGAQEAVSSQVYPATEE